MSGSYSTNGLSDRKAFGSFKKRIPGLTKFHQSPQKTLGKKRWTSLLGEEDEEGLGMRMYTLHGEEQATI